MLQQPICLNTLWKYKTIMIHDLFYFASFIKIEYSSIHFTVMKNAVEAWEYISSQWLSCRLGKQNITTLSCYFACSWWNISAAFQTDAFIESTEWMFLRFLWMYKELNFNTLECKSSQMNSVRFCDKSKPIMNVTVLKLLLFNCLFRNKIWTWW